MRAPHRQHHGRRAARGFTLIELLVAITVLSLIAVLSWRGLDSMVRSQQHTRERSDELTVMQTALAQWSADLDALMPLTATTPMAWDGQVLRLTRRSTRMPEEGALVVAWARRNANGSDQWLRWQSQPVRTHAEWQQAWQHAAQWARTPSDADLRTETVLMPLESWQMFFYSGGAWSNALSSNGNQAQSSGGVSAEAASLPEGVRVQLTLPPGRALTGAITVDWVNPVVGGNKS